MKNSSFSTIFNRITFITRLVMNDDSLTLEDINNRWRDSPLNDGSSINPNRSLEYPHSVVLLIIY